MKNTGRDILQEVQSKRLSNGNQRRVRSSRERLSHPRIDMPLFLISYRACAQLAANAATLIYGRVRVPGDTRLCMCASTTETTSRYRLAIETCATTSK
ncbi:unnamed protein product [Toxocara canis]|uniref:Uncharacterized protein n=1 Tax=Toxocara canis TaxID=6265 RepID=A0A183UA44_TOXCA|nr:unnamed protein product [Toxocara canis]